jgi:deoxyribodipyrimidine photo-lyase
MLSPHLRFGEISPNQIWWGVQNDGTSANSAKFLSELGWREFSYHQLFHNPNLASENLRKSFDDFPWQPLNLEMLSAWKKGKTGFSLVDAGMKELWAHGTMHNRVRMVAASFLVKNLGQDWRIGEQWFWDTLVDADEASNPASWQWVAGSGADAAPYFRIFNPELQADRFDPEWAYRKLWLDESDPVTPIIDLAASRARALADYAIMKAEHQSE